MCKSAKGSECGNGDCGVLVIDGACVSADGAGFVFARLHSANEPLSLLSFSMSLSLSLSVRPPSLRISQSVSGLVNAGVCMRFLA